MDAAQLADLVWAGGALVLVVIILLSRRARRPEYPDDTLKDPDAPRKAEKGPDRTKD